MLYSYSFQNRKRDLADILSTVVKDEPRFISNFKTVADATARKHEWLEDQLTGRSVTVSGAVVSLVCPASAAGQAFEELRIAHVDVFNIVFSVYRKGHGHQYDAAFPGLGLGHARIGIGDNADLLHIEYLKSMLWVNILL